MPAKKRDYKAEYKKFQSSTKAKKYRAELNKYNRKKGTYGNGDGKDASHKGGKIVGFESQSKNRGRAEKSRLKKEDIRQEIEEYVDGILDGMGEEFMVNEKRESVNEIRKFHPKKLGDYYLGGFNSSKGDTEMFADKKGQYYIWVKPKGKKEKYIDLPKNIKDRSKADVFHDKIKKTMGESVNEANNIDKIKDIVKKKSYKRIGGVIVDMQTANAILKVHKALNPANRKKYEKLSISKMADVAWKLIK